ncbi:MAG: choice-of-anchor V domain-containing protein [Betaproteobacteria bacterium]
MRILIPAAVVLATIPLGLKAFKEGPYPNVTGGFGEPSCHTCHLDNPLNAPGGSLAVTGVPTSYTPGGTYTITVTLTREGLRRGGFEVAARFASGPGRGRQAGRWRPLDARVQLIHSQADPSLEFVQHNLAGSRAPTRGRNAWTLEWTAPPAASAPIQFNVAANASNNDDSPLGDYIYLKAVISRPSR